MAQLNPSIILQGNSLNAIGALSAGQVSGQQQREFQRGNALSDVYQQHGPGIAAGDPTALNALSRFDPMAAQGAQSNLLGMESTRAQMGRLDAQEARTAAEYAAGLSAAERAAEAARIEEGVRMGMMIQTPEEWDQMAAQNAPELEGQFANREALAARYMSMAEILKRQDAQDAPPDPGFNLPGGTMLTDPQNPRAGVTPIPGAIPADDAPDSIRALRIRAQEAGLQPGTAEYQQFMAQGGGSGSDPTAPEARIARLMEDGSIDRNTAIGIVDGRLAVTRDPITGSGQIIDKANGQVVGQASEGVAAQAGASGGSSMPQGTDFATATGVGGFIAAISNTLSDAVGNGLVDQNNERATQAMQNLATNTMITLADGVAGRPSNFLLEQFQGLTSSPNSIWQGEGRTRERLNQTRDMIAEAILLNEDVAGSEVTPQMRAQAQQNISRLQRLKRDYDVVIGSFGSRSGNDGTSRTGSGVTWRVVE